MRGTPHSRAGSFGGPRRPAVLTTPAPLAPHGLEQPYTRPRVNSGASDMGYSGFGSGPLSGGDARSMRSGRSQVRMNSNTRGGGGGVGELPEINIEPPVG